MAIKRHAEFTKWQNSLVDVTTRDRVAAAIAKLPFGIGKVKRLTGSKISELVIDFGAGFRVYFVTRGALLIVLLAGGTKRTQKRDIAKAEEREREL